jgi:Na+/H+ antiporter NhaD/arsenite permease-like protein
VLSGFRLPGVTLDRAGAAVVGACAMVVGRVLTPGQALDAVDLDTLVLLLGMMVITAALTRASFFEATASFVLHRAHSPRGLLLAVTVSAGVLSALLVNDTICLMLTPLVLAVTERARLPVRPYLFALAMASNAGSAATFTGNPQNMLIGVASHQPWLHFGGFMALPALVSLGVVYATVLISFRHELSASALEIAPTPVTVNRRLLTVTLLTLTGVVVAFLLGYSMAWSALGGAAVLLLFGGAQPRAQLEHVDFVLLVFFAGLFVVIPCVLHAGWSQRLYALVAPSLSGGMVHEVTAFSLFSLVASNLFSNVPFVMLAREWVPTMHDPALAWRVLALASTLAGNLTLIGSVANLIVFEGARARVRVGFWEYARVGVPATLVSLALGVAVLLGEQELITWLSSR